MEQNLVYVTLMVDDYNEAFSFHKKKLKFKLVEYAPLNESKRWVRMIADFYSNPIDLIQSHPGSV